MQKQNHLIIEDLNAAVDLIKKVNRKLIFILGDKNLGAGEDLQTVTGDAYHNTTSGKCCL